MVTVVDLIHQATRASGELSILGEDGDIAASLPWAALHERAQRMATVLAELGVGPGARVGLLGDTSVDLIAALQATWLRGAALTVLPPPTRGGDNLRAIAADAGLRLLLADVALGLPGTLALPDLAGRADNAETAPPVRVDATDLAILQYTSGSTRSPRGVPITHGHLAANVEAIGKATKHVASHPSRMFSWLPLYHDLGLIGFLTLPMSCGCPLLLQSPLAFVRRPAGWLTTMSRYRVTTSAAPNFAYALLAPALAAGLDVSLDSVRFLLTGGEPIDAAMMGRFLSAAMPYGLDPLCVVPAYGLAESTLAVSFSPNDTGIRVDRVDPVALERDGRAVLVADGRALVRLGPPVPGTAVRIVDRTSAELVGDRTVGHIEIRGPSVVGHYWGEPAPAAGTWLRTGDLGYLADGELVVCGRDKDVLFAGGRNVFPQDVEAVAADVAGVRAGGVAAFGVAGEHGDRLVVAVESRADSPETVRREVAAAVLGEIGLAPYAVVTLPVGRLPKTSSGKLRRAETRRLYVCGELSGRTWSGKGDHDRDP